MQEYKRAVSELTEKINQNKGELIELEKLAKAFPKSKRIAEDVFKTRYNQIRFLNKRGLLHSENSDFRAAEKDTDKVLSLFEKQAIMVKSGPFKLKEREYGALMNFFQKAIAVKGVFLQNAELTKRKKEADAEKLRNEVELLKVKAELSEEIRKRKLDAMKNKKSKRTSKKR